MSQKLKETKADAEIRNCLDQKRSFYVIAGAGSGKTTSLVTGLEYIRDAYGKRLRRDMQRVVCITYTKRAVAVISSRLHSDDLFTISTLHSFVWGEIGRFDTDIRRALEIHVLPGQIAKKREEDDGGNSQRALAARARVVELAQYLANLKNVPTFKYSDSNFSDYSTGELGHDDVIDVAAYLICSSEQLRRLIGQKYPYIFVDEAQDTQENVVTALNTLCQNPGLPLVGYFGDPMQQIYDKRAGDFKGPPDSLRIPKEENFRCSTEVVDLLNAFRKDIQQFPAGDNKDVAGSVRIMLVQAERPSAPRGRYTPEQMDKASSKLDQVLTEWGWFQKTGVKHLYLVRQMIARRLNFLNLHQLFTSEYSSSRSQDEYESGTHFLLQPFVSCLYPLVQASRKQDKRTIVEILRQNSPAFNPTGENSKQPLGGMLKRADTLVTELSKKWATETVGEILRYCRDSQLCQISNRLAENLERPPRAEQYEEEKHSMEKGEWLADRYFQMTLNETEQFCDFIEDKTEFSTQHGVKGEQYEHVLVVFDDVGSAWNSYNFSKTLAPLTFGSPTERQERLSRNLAYVCFSRAEKDLRVIMFSSNAESARNELIGRSLFTPKQIEVMF
jgi:DNA helicase-2/ATP-dependent DNA helicase PcrA